MARPRVLDFMSENNFWLIDISPNLNPPFLVFSPFFGFSTCSGVEISANLESFKPANSMYAHHVLESADVSPITLTRGSRFYDTDFYRWIDRSIRGVDQFRRNFLLLHMISANAETTAEFGLGGEFALTMALSGGTSAALAGAAALLGALPKEVVDGPIRVPGRAWLLFDTIPVRYNAGSFDAASGAIQIMEIDLQPRVVVEAALGAIV